MQADYAPTRQEAVPNSIHSGNRLQGEARVFLLTTKVSAADSSRLRSRFQSLRHC